MKSTACLQETYQWFESWCDNDALVDSTRERFVSMVRVQHTNTAKKLTVIEGSALVTGNSQ
jgi:hypothetical protein